MPRTPFAFAVLSCLASTVAHAAPVRTLDGQKIETEDFVVVPFTMDDHQSVQVLRELSGYERVLAVNLDGASERSQLKTFLRSQGIQVLVVCDPEGSLRAGPLVRTDQTEDLRMAARSLAMGDQALAAASD